MNTPNTIPTFSDEPPARLSAKPGRIVTNPYALKLRGLALGEWFVIPPEDKKRRAQVNDWSRAAGVKCETYTSHGDPARGIARGSIVVRRIA